MKNAELKTALSTILHAVWYQNPHHSAITTMSPCKCGKGARGGGPCTECLEKELAKRSDPERAHNYVNHVRGVRRLEAYFSQMEETL